MRFAFTEAVPVKFRKLHKTTCAAFLSLPKKLKMNKNLPGSALLLK